MKIPNDVYIHTGGIHPMLDAWENAAIQISLRYGIFVEVFMQHRIGNVLSEIQFKVMDHVFDGLNDLEKALENRSFL